MAAEWSLLFDMDGTLLDSEPLHLFAWRRTLEEAAEGCLTSPPEHPNSSASILDLELFERFVGMTTPELAQVLASRLADRGLSGAKGAAIDASELMQRKQDNMARFVLQEDR